jgi:hypothetical protein
MVRRMAGSALAVPLQRHLGSMAVLADHARIRREVDVVAERDLANRRRSGHLKHKGQSNLPLGGNGVTGVAFRA